MRTPKMYHCYNSYFAGKSYKKNTYTPYGSDDGYDYSRDNRYGEVDEYVRFVQEWRKEQAEKAKKEQPPKDGG